MAEITESKTIEEVFQELDTLAAKLEDSETSLEDSFRFYKEGGIIPVIPMSYTNK